MSYLIFGIAVMLVTWYVTENNNKAIIKHHEDWINELKSEIITLKSMRKK